MASAAGLRGPGGAAPYAACWRWSFRGFRAALRVELPLPPSQHVYRCYVANRAAEADAVLMVHVSLHQTPRVAQRQRHARTAGLFCSMADSPFAKNAVCQRWKTVGCKPSSSRSFEMGFQSSNCRLRRAILTLAACGASVASSCVLSITLMGVRLLDFQLKRHTAGIQPMHAGGMVQQAVGPSNRLAATRNQAECRAGMHFRCRESKIGDSWQTTFRTPGKACKYAYLMN